MSAALLSPNSFVGLLEFHPLVSAHIPGFPGYPVEPGGVVLLFLHSLMQLDVVVPFGNLPRLCHFYPYKCWVGGLVIEALPRLTGGGVEAVIDHHAVGKSQGAQLVFFRA